MILGTVPLPDNLKIPEPVLRRPATSAVETLRVASPLGATVWLWCGTATPHRDDHLAGSWLVTLSVRSAHGIGDALTDEPETPFPPGTLAMIDPSTVHWLVPSCTEMADDAGRIELPLWVGLRWEIGKDEHAPARVRQLLDGLGGVWTRELDPRYVGWAKRGGDVHANTLGLADDVIWARFTDDDIEDLCGQGQADEFVQRCASTLAGNPRLKRLSSTRKITTMNGACTSSSLTIVSGGGKRSVKSGRTVRTRRILLPQRNHQECSGGHYLRLGRHEVGLFH